MIDGLFRSFNQTVELLMTHGEWLGTMSKAPIEEMSFGLGKHDLISGETKRAME